MLLLALLGVPIVVGIGFLFLGKRRVTPGELVVQIVLVGTLIVGGYYLTRWAGVRDSELWNGRVASKSYGNTSCCHSYECNCRQTCTGTGADQKCSETCSTCYEHSDDVKWIATSTNGEEFYTNRCNPPSTSTPIAWKNIRIGEPTVVEHRFTNYILADPSAVLPMSASATGRFAIPAYPVVHGWQARRFLFATSRPDADALDGKLAELAADLGAKKQVNIIIVVADEGDPAYFDALVNAWLGGKKNDVVLVIGKPNGSKIAWARVMAWNRSEGGEDEFKGGLAARIEALGDFDGNAVLDIVRDEVDRNYHRRSFTDFEYLIARAKPPLWAVIVLGLIGSLGSSLLMLIFWNNRNKMERAPHETIRAWWRRRKQPAIADARRDAARAELLRVLRGRDPR